MASLRTGPWLTIALSAVAGCSIDTHVAGGSRDGAPPERDGGQVTRDTGVDEDSGTTRLDGGDIDGGRMREDSGMRDGGGPPGDAGCVPTSEVCNAADDDCNGMVDEGACSGCSVYTRGRSVYLLCDAVDSWDIARGNCMARGYDLVIIDGPGEQTFLGDRAATRLPTADHFIGLEDRGENGTYRWVDDTVIWTGGAVVGTAYVNWRGGVPEDDDTQDCIEMDVASGQEWADSGCSQMQPYICEVVLPPSLATM